MKKIFSILISFLFVLSTFGIASVMAPLDCCDPANFDFSRTLVHVGDTFTISFSGEFLIGCNDFVEEEGLVELIYVKVYDGDGVLLYGLDPRTIGGGAIMIRPEYWIERTYKAVRPGTAVFLINCTITCESIPGCKGPDCAICTYENCQCSKTVTIASRALPMDWILKTFGLGKFKE